ncbi:hypothetical protein ACIOYT_32680 [Streptomyces halstedii]|uniref:hypothetical protein n=1 Tax=Streptomyces halstedii TaxID=1944 RepID=UPI0038284130
MTARLRSCGHGSGPMRPGDQAVVDQFRAMLTAVRNPEPWTPSSPRDISIAMVHPDNPHAAAYLHGPQLGYTERGWLRRETTAILGFWQPGYSMLIRPARCPGAPCCDRPDQRVRCA